MQALRLRTGAAIACAVVVLATSACTALDRQPRSARAVAEFKRANPCPATGQPRGACPGYVVDHIIALACSGADNPHNMQWQTVAQAKAKDRWERVGCASKPRTH